MTPLEERFNGFCDSVFGLKVNQDAVICVLDGIIFYSLLLKCSHGGLLDDEINIFAEIADAIIQS